MKRLLLLSATTILSAVMSAQTVERMNNLKPEQKSMAVSLKLTGELSTDRKGDYRQMRDLCFKYATSTSVTLRAPRYLRMRSIRATNSSPSLCQRC